MPEDIIAILHCTTLYYTTLHDTALYYTTLHYTIIHYTTDYTPSLIHTYAYIKYSTYVEVTFARKASFDSMANAANICLSL